MSTRKQAAGDTIEARCTRCRAARNHIIVAMVGERVARVQCNTCGGVHNYKPAGEPKAPAARTERTKAEPAARKPPKGAAAAEQREWEALLPTLQRERAVPYSMEGRYRAGDLVEHPLFGLGVVRSVAPGKAEILFASGRKLLRCA
jgi:hypothetical protein